MTEFFEPQGWEERYAGEGSHWSGDPNPQLVAEIAELPPGTALDVGCGEGGDVVWLAQRGWTVTGADFSANGLDRARRHAEEAGVADRCDWWQVDARAFDPSGRTWDLVTTHFLHPPEGGMTAVTAALAAAVAAQGHLLVVGHAPGPAFATHSPELQRAQWRAAELLPAIPHGFDVLVCEERRRTVTREGRTMDIDDAVLFARRTT